MFAGIPALCAAAAIYCADAYSVALLSLNNSTAVCEGAVLESLYNRIFNIEALADDRRRAIVEQEAGNGDFEVVNKLWC